MQNLKFCPKCGQPKLKQKNKTLLNCQNCDFNWFINPKPTVNVIFLDQNERVLLAKRAFEPKKNFWGLIGGFIDTEETLENALLREIEEETGLKIESQRLLYFDSDFDKYEFENLEYQTLGMIFYCILSQKEIKEMKPNDDALEFKFFDKENLPYDQIAFKSLQKALQKYFVQNQKANFDEEYLQRIRQKIDFVDQKILANLKYRTLLEKLVAEYKKTKNLQVLQPKRWQEIQEKLVILAGEYNLSKDFVLKIWEIIHQNSLSSQKQVLTGDLD